MKFKHLLVNIARSKLSEANGSSLQHQHSGGTQRQFITLTIPVDGSSATYTEHTQMLSTHPPSKMSTNNIHVPRKTTGGSPISAIDTDSLRLLPPDSVPARLCSNEVKSISVSNDSTTLFTRGSSIPLIRANNSKCSRTVNKSVTTRRNGTAGCLSFHPMAQCVVHALKGLACRALVTSASSALTSPALHARGCASPSRAR